MHSLNQDYLKKIFKECGTAEAIYQKIIELGRLMPKLEDSEKLPQYLVEGCQSELYLLSELREGKVYFRAESDALISSGLAYIALKIYEGLEPEEILKTEPVFLEELNLKKILSPSRSNGLASLLLKMKKEALKYLLNKYSV